jgi:hypothetical protein
VGEQIWQLQAGSHSPAFAGKLNASQIALRLAVLATRARRSDIESGLCSYHKFTSHDELVIVPSNFFEGLRINPARSYLWLRRLDQKPRCE